MVENEAKIKNGYVDYVYAFKVFDNSMYSFEEFIKKIRCSKITISKEEYNLKSQINELEFKSDFIEYINKRYETYMDKTDMPNYFKEDFNKNSEKHIHLEFFDTGIALDVVSNDQLEISQETALKSMAAMNTFAAGYYRRSVSEIKVNFLLQPFKIRYKNIFEYATLVVNIYKSGMSTLRVSLYISDLHISELSENNLNLKCDEMYIPSFMVDKKSNKRDYIEFGLKKSITKATEEYVKYLQSFSDTLQKRFEEYIHLTLIDYAYKPRNFENSNISDNYNKIIYKLLFAPVYEFSEPDKAKANGEISQRYYAMSKYLRHYISSSAKSISAFSEEIDNLIKRPNSKYKYSTFYFAAIDSILLPIEYILLERYSYEDFLVHKLNTSMNINELREMKLKLLDEDKFFFLRYGFGFGTLKELLEFMENKLDYYLQYNLIKERSRKVEELIKLQEDLKKEKFNIITRLVAMILTLIFSLPGIKNSIDIFKASGYPQLSNHVLLIWLLINMLFGIIIFWAYRSYFFKNVKNIIRFFIKLKKILINNIAKIIKKVINTKERCMLRTKKAVDFYKNIKESNKEK